MQQLHLSVFQKTLAFSMLYVIIGNNILKGVLLTTMDDGDSNSDNPLLCHKFVQAKRSPHLRV